MKFDKVFTVMIMISKKTSLHMNMKVFEQNFKGLC